MRRLDRLFESRPVRRSDLGSLLRPGCAVNPCPSTQFDEEVAGHDRRRLGAQKLLPTEPRARARREPGNGRERGERGERGVSPASPGLPIAYPRFA